jgi:hypothetical protein
MALTMAVAVAVSAVLCVYGEKLEVREMEE